MQLIRFHAPDSPRIAAVREGSIIDLEIAATRHSDRGGRTDFLRGLITAATKNPKALLASLPALDAFFMEAVAYDDGAGVVSDSIVDLRLLPFVPDPEKVIALGYNYRALCEERGVPIPAEPFIFSKLPSSITGPRDEIDVSATIRLVDFEAELAVMIGKGGRNISVDDAPCSIAGYTVINDLTAKAFPRPERPVREPALPQNKGPDGFGPMGDIFVTADELSDVEAAEIICIVNGEERQRFPVGDWVFSAAECVAYASQTMTLRSGDIFAMGSSLGMGDHDVPPRLLGDGDVVECRLGEIAATRNIIRYRQ